MVHVVPFIIVFCLLGDPTVFGNLKIPLEIEESVIHSVKQHKFNGYGPSIGKSFLFIHFRLNKLILTIY